MLNIDAQVVTQGYDRIYCRVNPVAVRRGEEIFLLPQRLELRYSDVFSEPSLIRSRDAGIHWQPPETISALAGGSLPGGRRFVFYPVGFEPLDDGAFMVFANRLTYGAHGEILHDPPRRVFSFRFDPDRNTWSKPAMLVLPLPENTIQVCINPQILRLPNGEWLVPLQICKHGGRYESFFARCRPTAAGTLALQEMSEPLTIAEGRGLYEPAMCLWRGRYIRTLRNDDSGYVTASDSWRHAPPPRRWLFDDGEWLGNYNTMTRFLAFRERLYLVYTRKGLNNDHIFRHRAPLLIAQIDPEKLCVIRSTEQVLVPERGARLCNYTAAKFSEDEGYVSVAEWMQTTPPDCTDCRRCEQFGANNRLWFVRIRDEQ